MCLCSSGAAALSFCRVLLPIRLVYPCKRLSAMERTQEESTVQLPGVVCGVQCLCVRMLWLQRLWQQDVEWLLGGGGASVEGLELQLLATLDGDRTRPQACVGFDTE